MMGWTTPGTATTGGTVTAAYWNTQVRDNLAYLFDQPMAILSNSGNQSLTTSSGQAMTFGGTVVAPTTGMNVQSVVGGASGFSPSYSGAFEVWCNVEYAGSTAGIRETAIYLNNSALSTQYIVAHDLQGGLGTRNAVSISGVGTVNGSTADYFYVVCWQNSGGALNVFGTATLSLNLTNSVPCYFGCKMLGSGG